MRRGARGMNLPPSDAQTEVPSSVNRSPRDARRSIAVVPMQRHLWRLSDYRRAGHRPAVSVLARSWRRRSFVPSEQQPERRVPNLRHRLQSWSIGQDLEDPPRRVRPRDREHRAAPRARHATRWAVEGSAGTAVRTYCIPRAPAIREGYGVAWPRYHGPHDAVTLPDSWGP